LNRIKKILAFSCLGICLASNSHAEVFTSSNNKTKKNSLVKEAYKQGIYDAIMQLSKDTKGSIIAQKVKGVENKYLVMTPIDSNTFIDIVYFETIASKLSLHDYGTVRSGEGRQFILYGSYQRLPDAQYIKRQLKEYGIGTVEIRQNISEVFYKYPVVADEIMEQVKSQIKDTPVKVMIVKEKVYLERSSTKAPFKENIHNTTPKYDANKGIRINQGDNSLSVGKSEYVVIDNEMLSKINKKIILDWDNPKYFYLNNMLFENNAILFDHYKIIEMKVSQKQRKGYRIQTFNVTLRDIDSQKVSKYEFAQRKLKIYKKEIADTVKLKSPKESLTALVDYIEDDKNSVEKVIRDDKARQKEMEKKERALKRKEAQIEQLKSQLLDSNVRIMNQSTPKVSQKASTIPKNDSGSYSTVCDFSRLYKYWSDPTKPFKKPSSNFPYRLKKIEVKKLSEKDSFVQISALGESPIWVSKLTFSSKCR
jgi:hypothetical protein